MIDLPVYTGTIRYPSVLYVAIEDEERARKLSPDMEIVVDWRLLPGCWYATSTRLEIPPMPEGFLKGE